MMHDVRYIDDDDNTQGSVHGKGLCIVSGRSVVEQYTTHASRSHDTTTYESSHNPSPFLKAHTFVTAKF